MNKLQEIRDALECAAHNSDDTNEMAYYYNTISTLDALMETHVLVSKEPTSGMLDDGYAMDCVPVDKLERAYKAMIVAAQEEEQQDVKVELDLDNARELFENWLTGNGDYPHLIHKSFGGQYLREEAAMKWDGFKAAYYAIYRAKYPNGVKWED